MTTHPFYWLQQIHEEIELHKKIPLWGTPPAFVWQNFCDEMKRALGFPDLRIEPIKNDFLSPEEFFSSLGSKPHIFTFELSPLSGPIFWILSSESISKLTALALSKQMIAKGFSDQRFIEGFYQYLILQSVHSFEKTKPYTDLHLQILESAPLPSEKSFATDIAITLHEQTFTGRLLFSPSFQAAFAAHFKKESVDLLSHEVSSHIDLLLSLEAGNCVLSQREWQEVNPGDFIILDRCSYDPVSQKGTLTLACRERPLFKVKIKKNNLKILDYAFYQGEQNNMDEEFKKESEGENEFAEDLDLEEEPPYVESEEDFAEESEHLWEPGQEQRPAPDTLFSAQEIPLNIVVEVDRIRMNLHKLLQLQPGNILELSARPEQGVSLTVNGKKIARAELIKLGDILGVKILEIGDKSSS